MTSQIIFALVGGQKIHCGGCEANIRFALTRLTGIIDVTPNAKTQRISVTMDGAQTTVEQVQARLKDLGFEVEKISH